MNSNDNIDSMQKEAMRRVQEMNSRVKNVVPKQGYSQPKKQEMPPKPNKKEEKTTPSVKATTENVGQKEDLLSNLLKDKERNLILILILILSNEDVDTGLLLALMYLII